MAELDVAEAPAEEPSVEVPAEAPAEVPAEVAPEAPPAEPTPPVEEASPLDLLIGKIETRLTNLEAESHSRQHTLDESAIKQIASLVLAHINESISKHL